MRAYLRYVGLSVVGGPSLWFWLRSHHPQTSYTLDKHIVAVTALAVTVGMLCWVFAELGTRVVSLSDTTLDANEIARRSSIVATCVVATQLAFVMLLPVHLATAVIIEAVGLGSAALLAWCSTGRRARLIGAVLLAGATVASLIVGR